MASLDEIRTAREELDRVNREHGFRRSEDMPRGDSSIPPTGDTGDPKEGENHVPPPADSTQGESGGDKPGATPADPGPPRFLGIDIEHKLAGLSGGGVIPISDASISACVDILLCELKQHLARTLGEVADTHGRSVQLDLFKDQPKSKKG